MLYPDPHHAEDLTHPGNLRSVLEGKDLNIENLRNETRVVETETGSLVIGIESLGYAGSRTACRLRGSLEEGRAGAEWSPVPQKTICRKTREEAHPLRMEIERLRQLATRGY